LRFEELNEGPNGDVLESGVFRFEEADEVAVETTVGLGPDSGEGRVVVGCEEKRSLNSSREKSKKEGTHSSKKGFRWRPQSYPEPRR
jgi:hypothetical protein